MTQDPYQPHSYPSAAPYDHGQQGYEQTLPLPPFPPQGAPAQPGGTAPQPGYGPGASGAPFMPTSTQPPVVEKQDGIGALFDFGFKRFATPSLVKIVYVLAVVMAILGWLGNTLLFFVSGAITSALGRGYGEDTGALGILPGFLSLLLGWIPALLYIMFTRVVLEFFVVQFRSHAQLREIKEQLRERG